MSRIDKLSIQGIRAFSANHPESIAFNTPLTLIVGFNGSGKTTIIESLRYATTGELPPNSKGGAFIHDPNLTGEKEVRAQVRLMFHSSDGVATTVTRNMLLTVKKGSRSQSTKECSLATRVNGERTVVSSKVMDIDKELPQRLGVSQAVLEAVIFCHQDESLWPMSEPSALKKKFDEIFEAQRYTKAVDQLKLIRKKQGEMLTQHKTQMELYKNDKEKGEKNEKLRRKLEREISENRDRFQELTNQMKSLLEQATEKRKQANSHHGILEELRVKNDQVKYAEQNAEQLRGRIQVLKASDEELKRSLEEYDQQLARTKQEREQKTTQYTELQATIQKTRRDHTAKAAEKGKHQSDKDKYERQLTTRATMIREAAERHEIWGYDGELDDRQVQAFYDRTKKMMSDKKSEVERVQTETADEIEKAASLINELYSKKTAQKHSRALARKRIMESEKHVSTLQERLKDLDVDESLEAVLQAEMKELESKLEETRSGGKDVELDKQIREVNDQLDRLERERDHLMQELVESSKLSDNNVQLALRKKELAEKKRNLDTTLDTSRETIIAALGSCREQTLDSDYQTALKRQNATVEEARDKREGARLKLKELEKSLSRTREEQKKLSAERDHCKKSVSDAVALAKNTEKASIDDYETELSSNEQEVTRCEGDLQLTNEWKGFFSKADTALQRSNKCYLCDRDFKGDESAKAKLMKKIAKNIDEGVKQEILEEKAEYEEKVKILRPVRAQFDTYKRLAERVPALDAEIKSLDDQKETLIRDLEDEHQAFTRAETKKGDIERLYKTVLKITQLQKEIGDLESKVSMMVSQQSSVVTVRSIEEIREAQEKCNEQMNSVRIKLNKLQSDRQAWSNSINSLELEKSHLRNRINTLASQLQQKKGIQEQVLQKKKECEDERETMKQADVELENLEPQISAAETQRVEKQQEARAAVKKATDERDRVANTVNELKLVEADIQDYLDRGGPANLASNLRALASLEDTIANLEREQHELTGRLNQLKDMVDKADRKRENIRDNLDLRKLETKTNQLLQDITELESRNAQEDYDRLSAEVDALDNQRTRRSAEREKLTGSMSSKQQEYDRLEEEFNQEYAGAKSKYREAHIKVITTKAAIADLMDYGTALDKAVMQYHTLKMEEINRTIAELWQSTYQGTDIDTILIRSDAETSTTSRKNYNYRVCMVKGDTEMDMRGRCSAGQRVLASIIIRLALSESFGVNCGLIALDEPTTNLDSDNIRSLAQSLHAIIKARRGQSNLQLIVITHDEEFLKHMQVSDFCDDFFRVKRDEHQNSVIVRENITEIMEV